MKHLWTLLTGPLKTSLCFLPVLGKKKKTARVIHLLILLGERQSILVYYLSIHPAIVWSWWMCVLFSCTSILCLMRTHRGSVCSALHLWFHALWQCLSLSLEPGWSAPVVLLALLSLQAQATPSIPHRCWGLKVRLACVNRKCSYTLVHLPMFLNPICLNCSASRKIYHSVYRSHPWLGRQWGSCSCWRNLSLVSLVRHWSPNKQCTPRAANHSCVCTLRHCPE